MSKITVLGTLSQYFTTGLSNEIFQTDLYCGTEEVSNSLLQFQYKYLQQMFIVYHPGAHLRLPGYEARNRPESSAR